MTAAPFADWQPMTSAPRDGTKVLVAIVASEQGAAEVDVVRWAKPRGSSERAWIAADSDPTAIIQYADAELAGWMPLPSVLPALRSTGTPGGRPAPEREEDGSGI